MGSKYAPYEVKMSSLEACEGAFETKNLAGRRQGDPQALCHSSDQTFETQTAMKDDVCFRCASGLEINRKIVNFCVKFEPSEEGT